MFLGISNVSHQNYMAISEISHVNLLGILLGNIPVPGHSHVKVVHMWREHLYGEDIYLCVKGTHMWEELMCGGTFTCGRYSHVEGEFRCRGAICGGFSPTLIAGICDLV